jgi:hypothetical protein
VFIFAWCDSPWRWSIMDRNMSEIHRSKYRSSCVLLAIISHFANFAVWLLSVPLGAIRTGLQFDNKYPIMIYNFFLTFIGPCIANIFSEYNQQDATFLNIFISVRRSTCFRRVFRPLSGAQNCTYSVRHLSDNYCYLLLAWKASSR